MIGNYYVTLRCNDTCEFCQCWQNSEYQDIRESDYQSILFDLKKEGIKELNITGGEPLLRDDLPELLQQAKQMGFKTQLATNGLLYAERGRLLAGQVDGLLFSLDYPIPAEHDRSRGIECFHAVMAAIEYAKVIGEKPIINYTLTRDSVRFLPEMIELAQKLKVFIYLNPVYDFFGTQGFEPATFNHLYYFARRKNVLLNRAVIEFVRAGGNRVLLPRCRAKETTVTVLPDGRRVSPCFYNRGGKQGREDICSSCMRWPYMLPSFAKGLDKYFWLDRYSKYVNQRKGVIL
ncbi:MAG: radical SAM protein [Candidatus Margulisbacteria bacterium]|nr:radical SAM protein [Candidatus Margulisiibacteriota bacterium]